MTAFASTNACTPVEILLAAFMALLVRYTGEEDLVIGWIVEAGVERGPGVVPMRASASHSRPFHEFLNDLVSSVRTAVQFDAIPTLADVIPHEPLGTFPFGSPICFQPSSAFLGTNGAAAERVSVRVALTGSPLCLSVAGDGNRVELCFTHAAHFYHSEFICRLANHYQRLIEGAIADSTTTLGELQVISPEEERELLGWSVGERLPTEVHLRHMRFQERARQAPDKPAVVHDGGVLTYRDLDCRSSQLAHYLRGLGVGTNVPVGIALSRSVDVPVAYFGVLKAGGVVFPIARAAPDDRLRSQLEIASPAVIIATDPLPEPLQQEPWTARVVRLDQIVRELATQPATPPDVSVSPHQLAFLMATSGSTGSPRIVEVPVGYRPVPTVTPAAAPEREQRHILKSDSGTTFTTAEIMRPLLSGGTLFVAPPGTEHDPWRLAAFIGRHRLTHLVATPSQLRALLDMDDLRDCQSLEWVNTSGEPLSHEVERVFFEKLDAKLVNMYGCTEAPGATTHECSPNGGHSPTHVGTPVPGMEVFVLDVHRRLCPVGVPGEVYLGGRLSTGYVGDAAATRERFVHHPFDPRPDARLFRTGDLGRWLPTGRLEILGRRDSQVKLRGHRIELGEIETRLGQHDAVADCVVILRNGNGKEQRLVAYWTGVREGRVTTTDLRRHLRETLPDYMVPSVFVRLSSIPLTPNGKVDRRSLPEPDVHRPDLDTPFVMATDTVQATLGEIWSDVLGVDQVGVNDNFLELGGDSLMAARVVARVIRAFGVEVPVQLILEATTLADVAGRVRTQLQRPDRDAFSIGPATTIPRRNSRGPCNASDAQRGFWFHQEYQSDAPIYNMPTLLRLDGPLDIAALESAIAALIERHETLRTVLHVQEGELLQEVLREWNFATTVVDVWGAPDHGSELDDLIRRESRRPFDLSSDLMIRATVFRIADDVHNLLLVTHHIATDGWSIEILLHELTVEYEARVAGRSSDLPELPIQYADYSTWIEQRIEQGVLDDHVTYWKEEMGGNLPVVRLPTKGPRPAIRTSVGARVRLSLASDLTHALNDLARSRGTTLFAVLMAGLQTLLHRYSGDTDVIVGFPIAGRRRVETERLVGNLINMLALRSDFSATRTFDEVLRRVHEKVFDAYAHQDLPFAKLVATLAPERDPSRTPLFDVMLDFANVPSFPTRIAGLSLRRLPLEEKTALFDLSVNLREVNGMLTGSLEYRADLFDAATVTRIASHFETLLTAVVADPAVDIALLPLMPEAEELLATRGFNDTYRDWPQTTVPALVETQVQRTPDAIAVEDRDGRLTYRELSDWADQLAAHLGAMGVQPGDLVGLCMERSARMVVGLLGILKSGAAYVPLDPTFPAARLAFMARDSNAKVVVSESTIAHSFSDLDLTIVALDELALPIGDVKTGWEQGAADDRIAYVMYTSGSTGKPKGVRVPHRCVCNFLRAMAGYPGLTDRDVLLAVTTLSFDISVLEVLLPLIVGGRVFVADADTVADGQRLAAAIETSGATLMQATPATWRLLLDAGWTGHIDTALSGGESLSSDLVTKLLPRVSRLFNMYGPTETTVWSTCSEITDDSSPITVGGPIANTQIYVLDSALQIVPIGVQGEVYIGGAGVAAGYLHRDELTRARFIPSPFAGETENQLYRTGDIGRWLEDGRLEIYGRADRQVKVRGHRIEPGEIESALGHHPAVRSCAVVARKVAEGDVKLVAYVVFDGSVAEPTVSEIRRFLRDSLPNYMVPGVVVSVDTIPRTPNNKVDHRALPDPFASAGPAREFTPPATSMERLLASVWCEILGIDRVGRQDNFYELGGHSLLSIRVVYEVEARTGHRLDPRVMFFQTLEQIASGIPTAAE